MSRKKTKVSSTSEKADDLASELSGYPDADDILDDELRDACDMEADMAYEEITNDSIKNKIVYLYLRGWTMERIKEIVEEESKNRE